VKTRLENPKEEHEKLKLIPEKTQKMSQKENSESKDNKIIKKEESKSEREKYAQRELEEIFEQKKRKPYQDNYKRASTERRNSNALAQTNSEKEFNEDNNLIVVWDLPSWAKRTQVFESVRYLGRVAHIEMLRGQQNKTRAEITFIPGTANIKELENLWYIPFMSKYLVRTTRGANSFEKLKERNKYIRRLVNLPEGTSEILL